MQPVALVTGASRGLGLLLANFLAGQGFHLILTARGASPLRQAAQGLEQFGGRVLAIPGDVTDSLHRERLKSAAGELGRLDLLVNNASNLGVTPFPSLAEYRLDKLMSVLTTNVLGPLALIQALLPLLKLSHGLVVNISSDAAIAGYPGWGAYGASKAALDLVSLTLAKELRLEGVAVVSVDPGDLRTQMHQEAFPGEDISDRPLPEITLPFWAWLLGQDPQNISGGRYRAQADSWEITL